MKKFSKLGGILMAVCLLGSIVGCSQNLDVTLKSPEVAVNDPEFTGKSVKLSWTPVVGGVTISRQEVADDSIEEFIAYNQTGSTYYDRISVGNELKAGATYKYRFYNTNGDILGDISDASRSTSIAIDKKYSCVEKEVVIDEAKLVAKGTQLGPFTADTFKLETVEDEDGNVTIFASTDEEEAYYYTRYEYTYNWGGDETGSLPFTYNKNNATEAEIVVVKYWKDEYYPKSKEYKIQLGKKINVYLGENSDNVVVTWEGKTDVTYTIYYQTLDNHENYSKPIPLTAKKITNDGNDHNVALLDRKAFYKALGIDVADPKPVSIRDVNIIVEGFDAEGIQYRGNDWLGQYGLWDVENTTYTYLIDLDASFDSATGDVTVTIDGYNVKDVDLYYMGTDDIIQQVKGKPFKDGDTYKISGLKPDSYVFIANADLSNIYNVYRWTDDKDYDAWPKNIVTEVKAGCLVEAIAAE